MNMGFRATYFINENSRRVYAAASEVMMDLCFNFGNKKGRAFLGMPGYVQVDSE